ncbi:helix-turn-helix domain-containing protein [Faecalicoccus pleomorphus]|uniref:helix-turn-helix domain-containing protein n=1 Tax=Faecalicoccus pleomorphus TaxID=1323 RepID=UPI0022E014BB|nr:S24 family peptidase [Faecalicoccus pleomorphus]
MSIGSRIKDARINKEMTQEDLASKLGVTKGAIANYENGVSIPKSEVLLKLFVILECDPNYIYQDEIKALENTFTTTISEQKMIEKYRNLDRYGVETVNSVLDIEYQRVKEEIMKEESYPMIPKILYGCSPSAGIGNYLPDDIDESAIMVPDTPKTRKADYVLKVDGKSMEPEYMDGDLVLIKKQDQVDIGEVGIYLVDGEALIKEAQNGYLHSLNPEFGNIELNENSEVHCMGKVIGKL